MKIKQNWQPQFSRQSVTCANEEILADSFYQLGTLDITHSCFNQEAMTVKRDLIRKPNAIAVLLHDEKRDTVVMVEQFRVGALDQDSPWLLELVAGIIEPGEALTDVVKRECLEETGLNISNLQHIYHFTPSPGGVAEYIDLFYANVDSSLVTQFHGLDDEGEDIQVHVIDTQAAIDMLSTGVINNGFSMLGLQWLQIKRLQAVSSR